MHAVGDPDELYRSVRGLDFTVPQLVAAGTEPEAFEALLRYLLKKPNPMRSGPANWSPHATLGLPLPIIRDTLRAASTRIEAAIETHRSSALADLLGYLAEASAGDPTLRFLCTGSRRCARTSSTTPRAPSLTPTRTRFAG